MIDLNSDASLRDRRHSVMRRFQVLCVAIALGAPVIADAAQTTTAGKVQAIRGFVSEDTLPGLYSFRRCEGGRVLPRAFLLNDLTPNQAVFSGIVEVRKSRQELDRPLYVEVRGEITEKSVNARRFDRAVGYVESCAEALQAVPANALLHAEGDDPAWRVIASPAGARFEIAGEKPIRFPARPFSSPQITGKTRVYDAWSREDGGSVRIEITEEVCVHSGKETAYGARVLARLGSRTFEGCASRY